MLHTVVEVHEENRHVSLMRGFLKISSHDEVIGTLSLDDIGVLLLSAQTTTITTKLITELAERGCITVFCGENYAPSAMTIPVIGNYQQAAVIRTQIDSSLPLRKNLWKAIVVEKINTQARILGLLGKSDASPLIFSIARRVRSGDPDNREAYAARMYWKALFGENFRRDRDEKGINALLNYGYAILRSAMARAVCTTGLLPALGIHHTNKLNGFCLVDDLFEPFRPLVDYTVFTLANSGTMEVTSKAKETLIKVLWFKVLHKGNASPLFQGMQRMAESLVDCYRQKKPDLSIPYWDGSYEELSSAE